MTVHLIDSTHLAARTIREAQKETSAIFATAGIEVVWIQGHAEEEADPRVVHVALLDGQMTTNMVREGRVPDDALGRATHGGRAYVFTSRVLIRSVSANACFAGVLGRVIAHEIGHVLLPEHSHAPRGIMQASLQLESGADRYFTEAQAVVLRNLLTVGN